MANNFAFRIEIVGVRFGEVFAFQPSSRKPQKVAAVVASRSARARLAAERCKVPHVVTDFEALLALDNLDALATATPPNTHPDMAMAPLGAGSTCPPKSRLSARRQGHRRGLGTTARR